MHPFHNGFTEEQGRVETQQLCHQLDELRKSVSRAYALRVDFQALAQEARSNITAAEALLQDINMLAGRLEVSSLPGVILQPLQIKGKKLDRTQAALMTSAPG
jgi:hypothetical protein